MSLGEYCQFGNSLRRDLQFTSLISVVEQLREDVPSLSHSQAKHLLSLSLEGTPEESCTRYIPTKHLDDIFARARGILAGSAAAGDDATADNHNDDGDDGVDDNDDDGVDECSICFEDLVDANYEVLVPCGHEFHWACITNWFNRKIKRRDCPMCRGEVVLEF